MNFHDEPQGAEPARENASLGEIADALFGEESALGDAIARRAWHVVPMASDNARLISDAILAMPEMQAIRRLLWVLRSDAVCHEDDGHYYTDSHDEWHKLEKALPHVAAWVRSDP